MAWSVAPVALLVAAAAAERQDEATCRSLGFAPSLLCSSCDKLVEHVPAEDPLIGECRSCCTEEVTGTGGTYSQAVLDICK